MKRKPPIKEKPLHQAGDSLRDTRENLLFDRIIPLTLIPLIAWAFVLEAFLQKLLGTAPKPGVLAIMALLLTAYCVVRLLKEFKSIRQLNRGLKGEIAVGQELERLRAEGFEVFHDIPGGGFNIDHVVVGSAGVFTIETKTVSKPEKGSPKIFYDGDAVLIDGYSPDRNPLVQARAQARWLRKLIIEATATTPIIRPVVIYPGWYVDRQSWEYEVWVLNDQAFPKFLRNERKVLTQSEIAAICFAIKRYVQTTPTLVS